MSVLRQVAALFSVEFDTRALGRGNAAIEAGIANVQAFAHNLASNTLVSRLVGMADAFSDQANEVGDASERFGMATDEYQELAYASRIANLSTEQFNTALATLSRQASGVRLGNEAVAQAFHALGVSATDAHGQTRPVGDLLDDLADGFEHMQDPARRVALAQQLFGEAGARLIPILHSGEGGVAALRQELHSLGGVIEGDAIANAGHYRDQLVRWNAASDGLRAQLANFLLPVMTRVVQWVTRATGAFNQMTRGTHILEVAMATLGAGAAIAAGRTLAAWLPAAAPFIATGVAVALLVVLFEDLYTLFSGGDSILGRVMDHFMGVGTATEFVRDMRDVWQSLVRWVDNAVTSVERFAQRAERAVPSWVRSLASGVVGAGQWMSGWTQLRWAGRQLGIGQGATTPGASGPGTTTSGATGRTYTTTRGVGAPPAQTVTAPAPAGPATTVVQQRNQVTIQVNGGTASPAEIAEEAHRRFTEENNARIDAAHPRPPRGS